MTESQAIISTKSSSELSKTPTRILSVDDDSDFLKVTKQILEVHGAFQVDIASSADEALDKLKRTEYDVVVSDYQMPGKDGLQFLKELRDGENDVPFILFTGKGREEIAIQALNLGVDQYFNKRGDPETVYGGLAHGIRQVVEKNRVEEELRMAGQEKMAILDSMSEQVEYLTPDLRFIWLNKRAIELTGMSSEQMVGRHCYEIYHKRDKPCVDCPVKKTLETGLLQEAEIIAPDGRILFMRNHPVRNLRGDIMGIVASTLDITKRKTAENALQESEERYRSLFESSREGIAFAGPEGKISKTNDSFAEMLGYDNPEELVGIPAAELNMDPKTRNRKLFQDILEKGYVTRYELTLKKKDGSPIHVLGSGLTRSDEDGNILQTEAFFTDITERKQMEEELKNMFNLSPDMQCVYTPEGKFIKVNLVCEKVLGYTTDEFLKLGWAELVHPDDIESTTNEVKKQLEGNAVANFVNRFRCKDGRYKTLEWQATPAIDGIVYATARDITNRKKAEEELIRLSTAVKTSSDSIVISDLEGKIVYVNDATLKMYDVTNSQDLIGKSSFDFVVPEDREKAVASAREVIEKGYIEGQEYDIVTKNGSRIPVEVNASVMKDADGKPMGFVGISRDITESKMREEEMKRRLMKFRLDVGNLYLVKESSPALSLEAFKDLLNVGYRGLVFSRTPEEDFKKNVDGSFEFRWLAERGGEKSLSPKFEKIENIIEKTLKKSVVLLDCLDYLILKNGFKETLFFVQRLREHSYLKGNVVILSVDPTTLSAREIRLLEKEGREVEPRVFVRLPEDLLEILRFIYEHNALGAKPNYSDVRQKLSISKPTVGKRIKVLVNSGYVMENPRGRSKILELTYKGMRLFLK
jgi:PAS domain S-box-containing protein